MASSLASRRRLRKNFERLKGAIPLPNLIDLQKQSYDAFLQKDVDPSKRTNDGLQGAFLSIYPIKDFADKAQLEFVEYHFGDSKFTVEECRQRGATYSAPLTATLRLVVWDIDEATGNRSIRDIKEQDVYMGDIPLMASNGTFVVNGVERVIVSQMHRSPGVFFDHDRGKTHASGKLIFSARVIPYRGSWLDFEYDSKDILNVRIDRRRKLPVTTLLMALENESSKEKCLQEGIAPTDPGASFEIEGMSREDILREFYQVLTYKKSGEGWKTAFNPSSWRSGKVSQDIINAKTGDVALEAGEMITPRKAKKLKENGLDEIFVTNEDLVGRFIAGSVVNESTGEVLGESGDELSIENIESFNAANVGVLDILGIDFIQFGPYLRNTLVADRNTNRNEALIDIYRVMHPGEPPTLESAKALFHSLFFDSERYDLSAVGRVKMNARLDLDSKDDSVRILQKKDFVEIIRMLLELKDGRGEIDDIDNLGNRRVRPVGELLENQYRAGLLRMERAIRERMGSVEIDTVMPHDLVNTKPVSAAVKEFFASSQLSQFMDQVNPLAEITHKRRLSALGPGGLTRDRASFEVRDVHPTHYGRICPIETPEGPNIGLINSLATYARVNKYGFIESPYRKVIDGKIGDQVDYLSAMEESRYTIAQADANISEDGCLVDDFVSARHGGDFLMAPSGDIGYIDVAPKQMVSVAASLIPFLETDDANRALMGSNMQRQAVPLMKTEAPFVGTGMEGVVARDSGVTVVAQREGVVDQVDSTRIVVRTAEKATVSGSVVDIYNLQKFQRSNHSTCISQKPLVKRGDRVVSGDVIADGPATDQGELALGRNVLVSFMSWNGYNFEDSIILSERLVKDDVFTSIHIEEFEMTARDTKLGQEEITRDIPNVGDEALRHLDEAGIATIGSEVGPGDILVGKVTPKGESPVTPEEKLLRAIFGEKASDVRDSSLRVPPSVKGTVVEVRVFSRRGVEKDERALAIEQAEINGLERDRNAERSILERATYARLKDLLVGQTFAKGPKEFDKGIVINHDLLESQKPSLWRQIVISDDEVMKEIEALKKQP